MHTNTTDLVTTPLYGRATNFYVVRHADYKSMNKVSYDLHISTSIGNFTVPQLGGLLTLNGRDSKIHVTDYNVGGISIHYSTAEVFTWQKSGLKSVLLLYGGLGETHEFAVPLNLATPKLTQSKGVRQKRSSRSHIIQWNVRADRTIVSFGDHLDVYLLSRNDVYNYWVLDLPAPEPLGLYTSPSRLNSSSIISSVIVKAGYLIRTASIKDKTLYLSGDVNTTTEVEVISAPEGCCASLFFNGVELQTLKQNGRMKATISFKQPKVSFPDLKKLDWKYLDSLPEIQGSYDDQSWTSCSLNTSNNPRRLTTPTSLYASDYGFHSGSLLYRGHFTSTGKESKFSLETQGGNAFGHSVWLGSTFLGSWAGSPNSKAYNQTWSLPKQFRNGEQYVITVLIDHMGLDQNFYIDTDDMKGPRGILNYALYESSSLSKSSMTWKMTGNLGGERYYDHNRGPLNEGALYAERQGYHLPGAPDTRWTKRSPFRGIQKAGVGFFATKFELDMPYEYDIPVSLVLDRDAPTDTAGNFRVQIFINGWQFGKFGMIKISLSLSVF